MPGRAITITPLDNLDRTRVCTLRRARRDRMLAATSRLAEENTMIKILVADPLDPQGMKMIEAVEGVTADVKTGLKEDELAAIVGEYDGMIIRSGVKITAKVLANPGKLKAIARAGVGVDNVDIEAATKAGI